MDPRYVRLPKGSGYSLSHQCCLTACVLGQYPSLHDLVKLITTLPQTKALGLPYRWKLVIRVGVAALFSWEVLSMAIYFGVHVVFLAMFLRLFPSTSHIQVDRVYPLIQMNNTDADKKHYCNNYSSRNHDKRETICLQKFHPTSQEGAMIPDVRNLLNKQ